MSGNSTGGRVTREDGGLWVGEATGLRLGDVPKEDEGSTGTERHEIHSEHEQYLKVFYL